MNCGRSLPRLASNGLISERDSLPNVKTKTPVSNVADLELGRRRTKRMALSVSLDVSGEDLNGAPFKLTTRATNLNRHGGMLRLNRDLSVGSTLLLKHRGHGASARVVRLANSVQGERDYGVELTEAEESKDFWGIHFPSTHQCRK